MSSVQHTTDGVSVTTASGSVFTGYGLVGADGVHSTIRSEMWRLADEEQPGLLAKDDRTCEYSFSVADAEHGLTQGQPFRVNMLAYSAFPTQLAAFRHPRRTQYTCLAGPYLL